MTPASPPTRRAVIDVGTNSVKLLVADVDHDRAYPVLECGEQTRLGQGLYPSHRLQPGAIDRTVAMVGQFAAQARSEGAADVRAFATSAARDAVNRGDLVEAVRRLAGIELNVVTGDQEAEWAFRGATSNPALSTAPLLLIDVGGGSSEFILGHGGHRHFSRSFPLGTVRTLEVLSHSDPPTRAEKQRHREHIAHVFRDIIEPALRTALHQERKTHGTSLRLVGTGGTVSILAMMEERLQSFDREKIESARLSRDTLTRHVELLWGLPLAQRRLLPGLPSDRADVMLAGAMIFEQAMEVLAFDELHVSTRGLRFEALRALWPGGT